MKDKECICPIVEIKVTDDSHVTNDDMRVIADTLKASVQKTVITAKGSWNGASSLFGPHRKECPCR
jgi:hypothetical protein